jgi:hypothetical protein
LEENLTLVLKMNLTSYLFLDDELGELSDKPRPFARFTVVVSKTDVICKSGMIHSRLVPVMLQLNVVTDCSQ